MARSFFALRARARRIRKARARGRRDRGDDRCGAVRPRARACSATSPNGTASRSGFALWFLNFSTFSGRHGIYLEDLFVRPAFRGKGIGKALMAHLAQTLRREGWARFEWSVLDWNAPSIAFYKSLGAHADGRVDDLPRQRAMRSRGLRQAQHDADRPGRGDGRERRDRARRRDAVAAEIRHAAFSRAHASASRWSWGARPISRSVKPLPRPHQYRGHAAIRASPRRASLVAPASTPRSHAARGDADAARRRRIMVIGGGDDLRAGDAARRPAGDHAHPCYAGRRRALSRRSIRRSGARSARETHPAGPDDDAAYDFVRYIKADR